MNKVDSLREGLYNLYKEEWIQEHVPALEMEKMREDYEQEKDDFENFNAYCEHYGFGGGSCYVCYGEFLDYEYQDIGWLSAHISAEDAAYLLNNDELFDEISADEIKDIRWTDGKYLTAGYVVDTNRQKERQPLVEMTCCDFGLGDEYAEDIGEKKMFDCYREGEEIKGALDFDSIKADLSVKIDTDYSICFDRCEDNDGTSLLEHICEEDGIAYEDYEDVANHSDYIFYVWAEYNKDTEHFDLYMNESYLGDFLIPLDENEQALLDKTIKDTVVPMIDKYNNYIDKNDVKKAIEADIIGVYWNDEEQSLMAGTDAVDFILSEDDFGEGEQAVLNYLAKYDTEDFTQMVCDYLDDLLDAGDEGSLAEYDLWAAEIHSNLEELEKSAKNKEDIER